MTRVSISWLSHPQGHIHIHSRQNHGVHTGRAGSLGLPPVYSGRLQAEPLLVHTARAAPPAEPSGGQDKRTELCPAGEQGPDARHRAHSLRGELGVAGRGEPSAQVLEDVEGQAADQGDNRDFPQEGQSGDEVHIDEFV